MVRPIAKKIANLHKVVISDEAIVAAVQLSSKYMSAQQLPDKAIALVDTAAARVKIIRSTKPIAAENLKADMDHVDMEIQAMINDRLCGFKIDTDKFDTLNFKKNAAEKQLEQILLAYESQKSIVEDIEKIRAQSMEQKFGTEAFTKEIMEKIDILNSIPIEQTFIHSEVDVKLIASIIGEYTGIPVGSMLKNELQALISLEDSLKAGVKGQDDALKAITGEIQAARMHIKSPYTPQGVFLLVGPSGVGKTETAQVLANLLFGGERFVVTINMSEYMEKHSMARLIGSPPGYVGSGEGGVLTEGIRQRPYTVVLLDEVEKADREVMNLFYQVFDKGALGDGDGRLVDCKNTVFIMTSNLASDIIMANPDAQYQEIIDKVTPVLNQHFKPALVGRMTVLPYRSLSQEFMKEITIMKLSALAKRIKQSHKIDLKFGNSLINFVISTCTDPNAGARAIDKSIRNHLQPIISQQLMAISNSTDTVTEFTLTHVGYKVAVENVVKA